MNQFNKDIIAALSSDKDIPLNEVLRRQIEVAANQFLQNELTAVLGYEPHTWIDRSKDDVNYRNGTYTRTIDTEYGEINLTIPRDRLNKFQNALFPPYVRRTDGLEEMVIKMYSKGVTTREIADMVERMYGHYYSPTTVSNITKRTEHLVEEFHERKFKYSQYVCVFLDATYIPLRRGTVEREAVNVAIGIRSDGGKEVLDYSIAPTENGAAWSELLQGLRARGIKDIQLFIADGLVGLQSAIEANYPQAKFQRCWVHAERNLLGYVRKNDRREIITDFKAIRQAENLQAAKERLAAFSAKWESSYKRRIKNLVQMEELFTFFSFPTAIRQTIYSTNLIESFNKSLKKMVRRKEQFPNEGALDRFIMTQVMEYNDKFENRAHRGFKDCHDTLDSMF